jgi:chromatin assembly factor 1 subunit B
LQTIAKREEGIESKDVEFENVEMKEEE